MSILPHIEISLRRDGFSRHFAVLGLRLLMQPHGDKNETLFALAVLVCPFLPAQTLDEPVVLTIDVENHVLHRNQVFDPALLGKTTTATTAGPQVPFVNGINIGDIVAINGKPVWG